MSPQAPVRLMVEGYGGALGRLLAVVRDSDATAEQTFIPLFEALNWAASIDLFFAEGGSPIQDDLLTAVRFARNRVHHQWAEALDRHENPGMPLVTLATSSSRIVGPRPGFWWYWVEAGRLPAWNPPSARPPVGEEEYKTELVGRSAEATLVALLPVLDALV